MFSPTEELQQEACSETQLRFIFLGVSVGGGLGFGFSRMGFSV